MAAALTMKTDDNGFKFFLENVKGSKLKSALKKGVRKSLNIIKKQAVNNLKAITFKNGQHLDVNKDVTFKNSYGKEYNAAPFKKAISVKLFKDGSGGRAEIIHRSTDRNWNPILKMMEVSKGERKTSGNSHTKRKQGRKAHSTGSIAHTFFTSAVNSTKGQVQTALQKGLEDAITKAKEKFYLK